MKMLPAKSYVAWGYGTPPGVYCLTDHQSKSLRDAVELGLIKESRAFEEAAVKQVFGKGITHYFTANSEECLMVMAAQYKGLYETEVKGICATILLGREFPERVVETVKKARAARRAMADLDNRQIA